MLITLALFTSTVTSKCTARVTQHVKIKYNICTYPLWKKNNLYNIRQNLTLYFQRRNCNRPGTKVMLESRLMLYFPLYSSACNTLSKNRFDLLPSTYDPLCISSTMYLLTYILLFQHHYGMHLDEVLKQSVP